MAATSKAELLSVSEKEFEKIMKLVATLDAETAMHKRIDDTSIKDVIE